MKIFKRMSYLSFFLNLLLGNSILLFVVLTLGYTLKLFLCLSVLGSLIVLLETFGRARPVEIIFNEQDATVNVVFAKWLFFKEYKKFKINMLSFRDRLELIGRVSKARVLRAFDREGKPVFELSPKYNLWSDDDIGKITYEIKSLGGVFQ